MYLFFGIFFLILLFSSASIFGARKKSSKKYAVCLRKKNAAFWMN